MEGGEKKKTKKKEKGTSRLAQLWIWTAPKCASVRATVNNTIAGQDPGKWGESKYIICCKSEFSLKTSLSEIQTWNVRFVLCSKCLAKYKTCLNMTCNLGKFTFNCIWLTLDRHCHPVLKNLFYHECSVKLTMKEKKKNGQISIVGSLLQTVQY